ncbi:MAG: hypothetical protein JWR67_3896 [Mucilaginibacter sp.]|nr:hypothetical protein [Mucilaginibacter sp.]
MSCHLSIIGEDLDIDTFVNKTQMLGFKKSYKGSPIGMSATRNLKYSVASITTSEAEFDNIKDQISDTLDFLIKYKDNLRHIASTPEIEYATINFGSDSTINEEQLTQNFHFTMGLIKICAELGIEIELSIYKEDIQVILEKKYQEKKKQAKL